MVRSLPDNALGSVALVMFISCLAAGPPSEGSPDGVHLVQTTRNQGAQIVVGWSTRINRYSANTWAEAFVRELAAGHTVRAAMSEADRGEHGDVRINNNRVVRGNDNTRLS